MSDERTKNDSGTPEDVLACVRALGRIGLDPCSNPWSIVDARVELSKHRGQCGLAADWHAITRRGEIVYCNPPWGRGLILPWVNKCVAESRLGVEIVLALPDDITTRWGRFAMAACTEAGRWRRRVVWAPNKIGDTRAAAFYYFGNRPDRFELAFERQCFIGKQRASTA